MNSFMANLDIGQDVANIREKTDSCSYSGQISYPIARSSKTSLRFSY